MAVLKRFAYVVLAVALCGCGSKQKAGPQPRPAPPAQVQTPAEPPAQGYVLLWKRSLSLMGKEASLSGAVNQALRSKLAPVAMAEPGQVAPVRVLGTIEVRCDVLWDAYGSGSGPGIMDEEDAMMATNKLPRTVTLAFKVEADGSTSNWDGPHVLTVEHKNPEDIKTSGLGSFITLEKQAFKELAQNLAQKIQALPAYALKDEATTEAKSESGEKTEAKSDSAAPEPEAKTEAAP
ncbi:MAG: hypothetical protein L6R28_07355 [Planctomycetes bacterium]|nr:hypothetical protein [Planctomycetota bacterium]